ncbi:hypothetical protein [Streptomyces sp. 8K308]|uniref:hypothetical protein n=1 Tax=Streptomyces sp. 8K308 TaxID=2530388 RepID=UPI001FB8420A|nr:hypothetical protein [Streptomyces sp. 8K308]
MSTASKTAFSCVEVTVSIGRVMCCPSPLCRCAAITAPVVSATGGVIRPVVLVAGCAHNGWSKPRERQSDPGLSNVLPAAAMSAPVDRTEASCGLVPVAICRHGCRSEPCTTFAGMSTAGKLVNR